MRSDHTPPPAQPALAGDPHPPMQHRRRTPAITCTVCEVTYLQFVPSGALGPAGWVCDDCGDRAPAPDPSGSEGPDAAAR
jgi:hypothetical protein